LPKSDIFRNFAKKLFMPTLYKYLGLSFYFWSNEHLPVHIHIKKAEKAIIAIFVMDDGKLVDIKFRKQPGVELLSPADVAEAKKLLYAKQEIILNRWMDYYIKNKNFKTITITKRIK